MNKENFSLVYFLTRSLFFGFAYSRLFALTATDSILSCILGTIIGILFIILINKINIESSFYKILSLILYIYFIVISLLILESFINHFFLYTTPKIVIILPSFLLCLYATFKNFKSMQRTSFILVFISFSLFLVAFLSLMFSYFKIENLQPMLVSKPLNIAQGTFIFASLSAMPNILLKNENISLKKHILYYLLICIMNIIICITIIGVLTPDLAKMYSFPEYMVLKRIKIFDFIENIENIIATIWYIDLFVFISLSFRRIYELIKNKGAFLLIVSITTIITTIFVGANYSSVLFFYHITPWIFLATFAIFIPSLFIKNRKKQ